ncbi:hypothetical protein [Telmatospirillum sp. J64-1]|uniref:hypothetical protein n=1 Tax=Telmatospirillum sp. J64-1 TaxID=2502183 RepID=UPI00115CCA63|nr:hypothetical protein [Telmatospirillum sp. J64-1]
MSDDPKDKAAVSEESYLKLAAEAASEAAVKGPVPVDPDVAELMGAFQEDALSEEDALDSFFDGLDPTAEEESGDE